MGFRFRRSMRLLPGIRINLSKTGASLTAGVRGAHVNIGKTGVHETIGIPGTGLSYRTGNLAKAGTSPKTPAQPRYSAGLVRFIIFMVFVVLVSGVIIAVHAN